MNGKDWELRDEKTQSTFFYNPCGGVHNKACPPGSALCEITNKDIAISYGSAAELTWAEGMFVCFKTFQKSYIRILITCVKAKQRPDLLSSPTLMARSVTMVWLVRLLFR